MENGKLINENNIDKIRKTFSKNQSEIIKIYKKKKKKRIYHQRKLLFSTIRQRRKASAPETNPRKIKKY